MLLLTVREWLHHPAPHENTTDVLKWLVTSLTLPEAISRIKNHERAYNEWSRLTVCFILVSVCKIEDLDRESFESVQMELIEDMKQTAREFK